MGSGKNNSTRFHWHSLHGWYKIVSLWTKFVMIWKYWISNTKSHKKFRQCSIVFEKPGIFLENLKTLTSSNYAIVHYFLLNLCTHFLLTNVYKRVPVFFFFYFLKILSNLQRLKRPGFYALSFYIYINNSISKEN